MYRLVDFFVDLDATTVDGKFYTEMYSF